jgi:hypothetical protein
VFILQKVFCVEGFLLTYMVISGMLLVTGVKWATSLPNSVFCSPNMLTDIHHCPRIGCACGDVVSRVCFVE